MTNIVTEMGNTWTVTPPEGVTVTQATPGGQLNISIDYDAAALYSGILAIEFAQPAGNTDTFGLRLPVVVSIENSLGAALGGFELYTAMQQEPAVRDSNIVHPLTYAHFHGLQATSFGPLPIEVFVDALRTNVAAFGPAGATPVPGWISGSGNFANGQTVASTPFVLHQYERVNLNDDFVLAFYARLPDGQQVAAIKPEIVSAPEGNSGTTDLTFTVQRAGSFDDINSTAPLFSYAVVGTGVNPADGTDFVGGFLPTGTVSFAAGQRDATITIHVAGDTTLEADENFTLSLFAPSSGLTIVDRGGVGVTGTIRNDDAATPPTATDWDALAERVLRYYEETGQWGLLSDWLGPNPPDGGGSGQGGSGGVDWDALSQRITAYFAATGQWGLLDDWLTPPPPDGGNTDYLI